MKPKIKWFKNRHLYLLVLIFFLNTSQAFSICDHNGEHCTTYRGGTIVLRKINGKPTVFSGSRVTGGDFEVRNMEIDSPEPYSIEVDTDVILENVKLTAPAISIESGRSVVSKHLDLDATEGSIEINTLALVLAATHNTQAWSNHNQKRGTFSKRESVHFERHIKASPSTLKAAEEIRIGSRTLFTEGALLKANKITFDVEYWQAAAARDHHHIQDETTRKGGLRQSHKVSIREWSDDNPTRLDAPHISLNVQKVEAQIGAYPGQSVEEALASLMTAYPDLGWMKIIQENRIHFETIERIYQEHRHKQSGLSPVTAIVLGMAATVATYGAGASFLPASSGLVASNMANAAFSSIVARSAVSIANHGGNFEAVLNDLFSSDSLKTIGVDVVTGGLAGTFDAAYLQSPFAPLPIRIHNAGTRMVARTAATQMIKGGELGQNLKDSLSHEGWNFLQAQLFHAVGDYAQEQNWEDGSPEKVLTTAAAGAIIGQLKDGKPLAGAAASATAEVMSQFVVDLFDYDECWEPGCEETFSMDSQEKEDLHAKVLSVVSTATAAITAELVDDAAELGADIGQSQHLYNRQLHSKEPEVYRHQMAKTANPKDRFELSAAACYLTRCSAGVHPDHELKTHLVQLEHIGRECLDAIWQLQTTGLFKYTEWDNLGDQWEAGTSAGVARIAASYVTAIGTAAFTGLACVISGGVGCAAGGGGILFGGMAVAARQLDDGINHILGQGGEAEAIKNTLSPDSLTEPMTFWDKNGYAIDLLAVGSGGVIAKAGAKIASRVRLKQPEVSKVSGQATNSEYPEGPRIKRVVIKKEKIEPRVEGFKPEPPPAIHPADKAAADYSFRLYGLDKPVRLVHPDFPPNQRLVDEMKANIESGKVLDNIDCSEFAEDFLRLAGDKGKILEVRPKQRGQLTVYENNKKKADQYYHQIYTDGRYIYDPRLTPHPIPKGDWEKHIKKMNPEGVTISDNPRGLQ
ncbi:MAG: DUF637 domain-containing protein [Endozoicomonas sp.]|uniref:DUF637 domain-containing protein n=1 Tax=Endozoicomonas sp. TaxID=1892382 RepID=UPI003D9B1E51